MVSADGNGGGRDAALAGDWLVYTRGAYNLPPPATPTQYTLVAVNLRTGETRLPSDGLPAGGQDAVAARTGIASSAMTHSWLFTGPPGSGRSVAALCFAAALQCTAEGTPG